MGFDEETLAPTYKLHVGLPGKSAGLDIAARLGMPEEIIRRARASMSDRERDISRFLRELHRQVEETSTRARQLAEAQLALAARGKELAREWEKRESAKLKELERRCDLMLANFESLARETIERMEQTAERKKAVEQAQRSVAKTKRELREEFETTVLATKADARQGELGRRPKVEEGARVRLKGIREPARGRRGVGGEPTEGGAGVCKRERSQD